MNSKQKGNRGEREFASLCREHGYDCRRTQQFAGGTEESADVIGLPNIHIEVKRVEKLNIYDAIGQAVRDSKGKNLPIVAHRKNDHDWLITMKADDWFKIFKEFHL